MCITDITIFSLVSRVISPSEVNIAPSVVLFPSSRWFLMCMSEM